MVRLTRALLPLMGAGGSVINQSSIWGHTAVAGFSAYVASKHAVLGVTRSLAWELASAGIRVNAVCPGWIRTEAAMRSLHVMAAAQGCAPEALEAQLLAQQATPRLLEPADLAGAFLFLACDDAHAITGQSLVVSHGEVMQ
jgi:NAD(P)-dependent dehydrogenase (short-subunit alcohol dehydrogenase family)